MLDLLRRMGGTRTRMIAEADAVVGSGGCLHLVKRVTISYGISKMPTTNVGWVLDCAVN